MIVIPLENYSTAECQHDAIRAITPRRARTDIFPCRAERVEVVDVLDHAEEPLHVTGLVANDEPALAQDDGPKAHLHVSRSTLVDLERVLACRLEEDQVRHRPDVCLPARARSMCSSAISTRSAGAQGASRDPSVPIDGGGCTGKLYFATK